MQDYVGIKNRYVFLSNMKWGIWWLFLYLLKPECFNFQDNFLNHFSTLFEEFFEN